MGWLLARSLAIVALALFSNAAEAREDDAQKQLCISAYEGAQRSRKQGELLAALEKLRYCGSPACPRQMHPDCERWLREVEESLPTVVFRARSSSGQALTEGSFALDGGAARRFDGRAQPVDPGEHEVTVSCPGFQPLTRRFLFAEGGKLQEQVLTLDPVTPSRVVPHPDSSPRSPFDPVPSSAAAAPSRRFDFFVPLVAASGLVLLGGSGFAYFGLEARAGDRALASCTPTCSRDRVDRVERDYLFANISLGVGVAGALGGGALLILSRSDGAKPSPAARSTLLLGPTTVWTTRF